MSAIVIRNPRYARRLLAKTIQEFQEGKIEANKAKTLAYLVQVYTQVYNGNPEKYKQYQKKTTVNG